MPDLQEAKDLLLYKKMYHCLLKTIIPLSENCKDPFIRAQLIKAQTEAEEIFINGE